MSKLEKDSLEGLRDRLWSKLESKYPNCYIVATFPDSVIVNSYDNIVGNQYYEVDYTIKDDEIEFGERTKVNISYVTEKVKKNTFEGSELTGPIFKQNEEQKIVYAAVLVPGEPDYDADLGEKLLSAEEIERVAHKWMEDYGNIDHMHGLVNVAKPIESYILPLDMEVEIGSEKVNLPKGTWILGAKVTNDKVWKEVKEGKLTGFSIMGIQNSVLKEMLKDVGEEKTVKFQEALKRILIRDLGDDWIVPFVSLVDEPCVPKAKIFAIKRKDEPEIETKESMWNKLVAFFKKNELKGEDEMNEEQIKELVEKSIAEALKPLQESIEALKTVEVKEEVKDEPVEDVQKSEPQKDESGQPDLKAENEALKEKLAKIEEEKKAVSKAEKGQEDGEEEKPYGVLKHYEELGRNSLGIPITKKGVK